jgi:BirA family transcriptional regulator, biotin operon repressor / biotin---[acetyl-CoA-carboxylase] ligase
MPALDPHVIPSTPLDLDEAQRGLATKRLDVKFHYFCETDSTNTQARRLAEAGAAEGEVVVADAQSQGRGRLGRVWQSPPFANLYLSILLRPNLPPANAAQITLMAAVSLAETVESFLRRPTAIKWPNDLLIDGKKLAGILTEAACDSERVEYVILGIGLNLNYNVHEMPAELRGRATSLAHLTGRALNRESVLRRLIQDLDRCYGELETSGFEALRPRWEARFIWRGRRVRVELGDQVLIGRAQGIEPGGALILEEDDGQRRRIVAGDVIPLEI